MRFFAAAVQGRHVPPVTVKLGAEESTDFRNVNALLCAIVMRFSGFMAVPPQVSRSNLGIRSKVFGVIGFNLDCEFHADFQRHRKRRNYT